MAVRGTKIMPPIPQKSKNTQKGAGSIHTPRCGCKRSARGADCRLLILHRRRRRASAAPKWISCRSRALAARVPSHGCKRPPAAADAATVGERGAEASTSAAPSAPSAAAASASTHTNSRTTPPHGAREHLSPASASHEPSHAAVTSTSALSVVVN